MRVVYLPTAPEGTVVGRPIRTTTGTVLVAAEKALSRRDIDSLVRRGVYHVYAYDHNHQDINPVDVIDTELRDSAGSIVRESFETILRSERRGSASLATSAIQSVVGDMVDMLSGTRDVMLDILAMFDASDYLFRHAVNAAVLAVMAGREYGLPINDLLRLGQAMLLHDLGMVRVPKEVYEKQGKLTVSERELVNAHPRNGSLMALHSGLSPVAANTILRHHEYWDGSGYPDGLAGEEIPELARIASVVEVYDAMTSPRPYAKPVLPHEAISWILSHTGAKFEPKAVAALVRHIAVYPAGVVLELNTGECGLSVKTDPGTPASPFVRVLYGPDGHKLPQPINVDLREDGDRCVIEAHLDFAVLRDARLKRTPLAA